MSANIASGGRVWSFDKTDTSLGAPSKPKFLEVWGFALWYGLPAGLLVSIPGILFLLNGAQTPYEQAQSIAGGWGAVSVNPHWSEILFSFGTAIFVLFALIFLMERMKIYGRSIVITVMLVLIPTILTGFLVARSYNQAYEDEGTFKDWAQSTYGYTLGKSEKEGSSITFEAKDKDGRAIKVQSFVRDKNTYLYETLPQLNEIITRIVSETEGKS